MNITLLNIDLERTFPTTAAAAKDYLALDFKLSTINSTMAAMHATTRYLYPEHQPSEGLGVKCIRQAITEHPQGAQALLDYFGVSTIEAASVGVPRDTALQKACRALGEVVSAYRLSSHNATTHAALLQELVYTREDMITTEPGRVYNSRAMMQVFGYLLLRATQLRMENMGTAPGTTRNRLQTVVNILGRYVDDFQIKINDGNWRELLMVYLANAVD